MKRFFALIFAVTAVTAHAQITSNEELRKLVVEGEAEHEKNKNKPVIYLSEETRTTRVLEILKEGKINTAEDFLNAGLIFQLAGNPEDSKLAYSFATIAAQLAPAHRAPKWLAAVSLDRYMMWKNSPQWYGTQVLVLKESGKRSMYWILPGTVSDEERAAAGLPSLAEMMADIEASNK